MSTSTSKHSDKKEKKTNKKFEKTGSLKQPTGDLQPQVKVTAVKEKSKVASTKKSVDKEPAKKSEENLKITANKGESSSNGPARTPKLAKDKMKDGKPTHESNGPRETEKSDIPTHISAVKRKRGLDEVGQEDGGSLPAKRKRGKTAIENTGEKQFKKKKPETSLLLEEDSSDPEQMGKEDEEKEDDHLHGFSTDEDSSDDDMMDTDPLDVKKLPKAATTNAIVRDRLEKAKKKKEEDRGVLYLGRIPHGFYEEQMKEYFSQFGNVTRLRLARNKKSGKSKHYGFIEFDSASVAKIVSETMDNYLLAGHLLQCKIIPSNKVHPELWIGANRKWKRIPQGRMERLAHNKTRTDEQKAKAQRRLLKRQAQKEKKIKEAGINYSLSKAGYTSVPV